MKENAGQELGDIRYSFFHHTYSNTPYFGFGPSDANPATGEIVSGTVNFNTYSLDWYIKYLLEDPYKRDNRSYKELDGSVLKNQKTKFEESALYERMREMLKEEAALEHEMNEALADQGRRELQKEEDILKVSPLKVWTHSGSNISAEGDGSLRADFKYLLSQLTFGFPLWSPFTSGSSFMEPQGLEMQLASTLTNNRFVEVQNAIQNMRQEFKNWQKMEQERISDQRNTTIYPLEPVISSLPRLLSSGLTPEAVKERILFTLVLHEFGHVLNLRHNFYGSADHEHYLKNEKGEEEYPSSSVMDYLRLKEEAFYPARARFLPYDEAALVYAYSGGARDLSKERKEHYLFCTDHHVQLNAMCGHFDTGSTASEVALSLVENYEERYFIANRRLDRAYWNTSGYRHSVFRIMLSIKQFLMMWRTAFSESLISEKLSQSEKDYTQEEVKHISYKVEKNMRQAIKLGVAFMNSVLQLPESERDWKSFYETESGSMERMGISWDKMVASFFFMGDDPIAYNPNRFIGKSSYLTYVDSLGFRQMMEELLENNLTKRVDMFPWFIDMGRALYAQNASNYYNLSGDGTLLEKIGVRCYTAKGLKDRLGIDPQAYSPREGLAPEFLDTALISMAEYVDKISDPYFENTNEKLGVTFFDGKYYVSASHLNKYAYSIIENMRKRVHSNEESLRLAKQDIYDLYYLYNVFKKNDNITDCDDGY